MERRNEQKEDTFFFSSEETGILAKERGMDEGWAWLTERARVLEPHASSASTTDNVPPPLPGPSPAARAARKPTTPAPLPPSGSRVEQLPASQTPRAFANGTTAAAGAGRSPADMIELAQQVFGHCCLHTHWLPRSAWQRRSARGIVSLQRLACSHSRVSLRWALHAIVHALIHISA